MPISVSELENWFTYHPPTASQVERYGAIRDQARAFAEVILALTPPSADQSAAIRLVREAVMTANAAIACEPAIPGPPDPPRPEKRREWA